MMQPYQQTDAYRRCSKIDPITQKPVWPLRIIEQRQAAEKREGSIHE